MRVFNKDFVRENVFTATGTASPIFVLGEESVEKQTRIEKLRADVNTMGDGLSITLHEKATAEADLDNYSIAQAKAIKTLLSSSGTNRYNNYDKSEFRAKADALIASGNHAAFVLNEPTKEALRKKKEATRKEKITPLSFGFLDPHELLDSVAQTLATTVISK